MKAVTAPVVRPADFAIKPDCKISKAKLDDNSAEMQSCFLKLKELVPTVPHNKKISKTALLQHVIDYILDLELTLEFHPAMLSTESAPCPVSAARTPLTEKTTDENTMAVSEACAITVDDVMECESRPASK